MGKLILAIITVVCVHIGFAVYMAAVSLRDGPVAMVTNSPWAFQKRVLSSDEDRAVKPIDAENPAANIKAGPTAKRKSSFRRSPRPPKRQPAVFAKGRTLRSLDRLDLPQTSGSYALRSRSPQRSRKTWVVIITDPLLPEINRPALNKMAFIKKTSFIAKLQPVIIKRWEVSRSIEASLR